MTTERIDHVAQAKELLSRSAQFTEPDAAEISADLAGLTHSVLALAEQQRLANLLRLAALNSSNEAYLLERGIDAEIRQGLGLDRAQS